MATKQPKSKSKKEPTGVFQELSQAASALQRARQRARSMRNREKAAKKRVTQLEADNRKLTARAKQTGKHYLENRLILLQLALYTINRLQANNALKRGKERNINITVLVREMQRDGLQKSVRIRSDDADENLVPSPIANVAEDTLKKELGAIFRGVITARNPSIE